MVEATIAANIRKPEKKNREILGIYIIKVRVCVFVCGHSNVQTLTSPPVLKLWDSQGYAWLPYDLMEVIKLIGVTFKQKIFFS